ncbi:hypothetical protein Tco_1302201 [Tanacetum coccineum]
MILGLLFKGFPSTSPHAATDVTIPDPTLEDLAAGTPNAKVIAKAEASKMRKASTYGSAPSHVAKRTSDDDEDACVEFPLITPIRSVTTILIGGNQSGGSIPSATEGRSIRDSRGKAIMSDVTDTPSGGASRSQAFTSPTPASQDPSSDATDMDFFPFFLGPYYDTYHEDGVVASSYEDLSICKTVDDQFPTPVEMVQIESLIDDRLAGKISVLRWLMMSYGGELLARHRVSGLQKQVTNLNDKVTASDAAFVKAKTKATYHSKDNGTSQALYLCQVILRNRCIRMELITPNLICPLTYLLLRSSGGNSGPDMSFNKSASPECDWFSFSKRYAHSLRHLDEAIDDLRPAASSFSMADVRRLSAHIIKLRDMPEDVLVLSRLSRVWKSRVCDPVLRGADGNRIGMGLNYVQDEPHLDVTPTLQRLPFYYTPTIVADVVIPYLTPEDLAVGTPSAKILAKAEASQKRKASTSSATSSHIAKRTSDGDDDACIEILLVTWNGYLRKGRKTKPKQQNRTRNGKAEKDKVKVQAQV